MLAKKHLHMQQSYLFQDRQLLEGCVDNIWNLLFVRWVHTLFSWKKRMRHRLIYNLELTASLVITSPKKNHNGFLDSTG